MCWAPGLKAKFAAMQRGGWGPLMSTQLRSPWYLVSGYNVLHGDNVTMCDQGCAYYRVSCFIQLIGHFRWIASNLHGLNQFTTLLPCSLIHLIGHSHPKFYLNPRSTTIVGNSDQCVRCPMSRCPLDHIYMDNNQAYATLYKTISKLY